MSKDPGARCQSGNEVIRQLGKIYKKDYATQPREDTITFVASGGFFGRDAEIRELFERVQHRPLTVLFGQSGLGKTSLLQAGLVPRLRDAGFQPSGIANSILPPSSGGK